MCKPVICYWQDPHIQEYKFQKRSNFHMQELLKRTGNSKSIFNWVQWSRTFKIECELYKNTVSVACSTSYANCTPWRPLIVQKFAT